jgi:glycosyltransferase involved in cell wall biosynthesis
MLDGSVSSILTQTHRNLELIVVDDSTDPRVTDYLSRAASADHRVICHHNKDREGYVRSLNMALALAKGEFIAKMDADDVSEIERIKTMMEYMKNNPSVGVLGSACKKIGPRNEEMGVRYYPERHESIKRQMCIWNAMAHSTVMVRRKVFERVGLYDENVQVEDYELWLRCLRHSIKFANIPQPLLKYRIYPEFSGRGRHWKENMALKVKYFSTDCLLFRLIGILSMGIAWVIPVRLERPLYGIFNRLR